MFPDLSLPEAAALAIVLAATDAALGQAVVTDERLPVSIREGLNVESGLNDGLCVPALIIALTLADESAGALSGSEAARVIAESIGYGVLMGVVAGVVAALVHRRATTAGDEEQADWRFLLTLVAPALAYGLAAPLDGSGFIAAFVAGLVYGTMRGPRRTTAPLPAEAIGVMLNAVTFVVFGAAFLQPLIERATWSVALYALLSLTVVRMLPVAIATLGTGASPATVAYLGWFGPRGLASIVFAVIVVEAAVPHTSTIVDATALTVIASIVLHGFYRGAADRALREGDKTRKEHRWPRASNFSSSSSSGPVRRRGSPRATRAGRAARSSPTWPPTSARSARSTRSRAGAPSCRRRRSCCGRATATRCSSSSRRWTPPARTR